MLGYEAGEWAGIVDGVEDILIAMGIGQRQQHDFMSIVMQFLERGHDIVDFGFRDKAVAVEHRIMR